MTERASVDHIAAFLSDLGEIGRLPDGGYARLGYSPEERSAHDLFADRLRGYGLQVHTDAAGNTIATLPGTEDLPALVTGSHLDTVPGGGNFDGAVGVVAAVEVARLSALRPRRRRPLRIVAFATEEGARFGTPCIGSRVLTGAFGADALKAMTSPDGRSAFDHALEVGLDPAGAESAVWSDDDVELFLEVHIEQGRILEERDIGLGVVSCIGGSRRTQLTFTGRADHSGGTPMDMRTDALAGAAEFVLAVERTAAELDTTVATVGRLDVLPNSLTTVPGEVTLGLDVRDIDAGTQSATSHDLIGQAGAIAARRGLGCTVEDLSDQLPVALDRRVIEGLESAVRAAGHPYLVMPSGASHDAAHLAARWPTGMLFVPCREGISHSSREHAEPAHIAPAVDVVMSVFDTVSGGF